MPSKSVLGIFCFFGSAPFSGLSFIKIIRTDREKLLIQFVIFCHRPGDENLVDFFRSVHLYSTNRNGRGYAKNGEFPSPPPGGRPTENRTHTGKRTSNGSFLLNQAWIPLSRLETVPLQENLAFIRDWFPDLHQLLSSPPADENLFIQAGDGGARCRTEGPAETWIFGQNSIDDEKRALESAVSGISPECNLVVLIGSAMGWALVPLLPALAANPERKIVVLEPTKARLRACFAMHALGGALSTGRLHFDAAPPALQSLHNAINKWNLWDEDRPAVFCSPETRVGISAEAFEAFYRTNASQYAVRRRQWLDKLRHNSCRKDRKKLERVLLADFWPGMPQSVHLQSVQRALAGFGVKSKTLTLNPLRIEAHPGEYAREIERSVISAISNYQPCLIVSYAYHAPHLLKPEFFEAVNAPWLQVVSNIAFYDETYYPGETTAAIDRRLIPMYEARGARRAVFAPIMADYVEEIPVATTRRHPLVFVGNAMSLGERALAAFREKYAARSRFLAYLDQAERELGDFDAGLNLYDYMENNPCPQTENRRDEYEAFRYLLCQATHRRRLELLQALAPMKPAVFGFWTDKLPSDSPINPCLFGELPIRQEPALFAQGGIFLNIHSVAHVTGPNMRFFNTAGMGAFQITDGNFGEYLREGEEAVYFSSKNELLEKTRYYLEHPDEMDAIRARACKRVKAEWTYKHWLERVLPELGFCLPPAAG